MVKIVTINRPLLFSNKIQKTATYLSNGLHFFSCNVVLRQSRFPPICVRCKALSKGFDAAVPATMYKKT